MTWNYRVVKKRYEDTELVFFGIHEVYYDEEGKPNLVTQEPIDVSGESVEDLLDIYETMKEAFRKPVLLYEDFCEESNEQ